MAPDHHIFDGAPKVEPGQAIETAKRYIENEAEGHQSRQRWQCFKHGHYIVHAKIEMQPLKREAICKRQTSVHLTTMIYRDKLKTRKMG